MAQINYETRQIYARVVYYGASQAGKTTNLEHIFRQTAAPGASMQRMAGDSMPSGERYEMLPMRLGDIRGFSTHFELYTAPSAANTATARRQILDKVDGLVFVADSQPAQLDANRAALSQLRDELAAAGYALDKLPLAMQYNKRDVPGATPLDVMRVAIGTAAQVVEATAVQGVGVFDALKAVAKLVLTELRQAR